MLHSNLKHFNILAEQIALFKASTFTTLLPGNITYNGITGKYI